MAKLFQLYENRFVCCDVLMYDICASTMLKPHALLATEKAYALRNITSKPLEITQTGKQSFLNLMLRLATPSGFLTFFTWQASLQTLKDPTGARRFPTVQHAAQSCSYTLQ